MRFRLLFCATALLAACGGPGRMPTGPAPEYEPPRPPSWMNDGGAPAPAASSAAPAPAS